MDMSKYRGMFLSETSEHLGNMSRLLLAMEGGSRDGDTIHALFREAHSIKGMASSMGYGRMAELAHHLEDGLDAFRRAGAVPAEGIDRLLAGLDLLEGLLEDIEAERPERDVAPFLATPLSVPEPSPPSSAAPEAPPLAEPPLSTLHVAVTLAPSCAFPSARAMLVLKEMGRLATVLSCAPGEEDLRQGGPVETLTATLQGRISSEELRQRLLRLGDVAEVRFGEERKEKEREEDDGPLRFRKEDRHQTVRVRTPVLDRFVDLAGELITSRYLLQNAAEARDWELLRQRLAEQGRLIGELHHQVRQVRLMPLESVTGRLPRLVRELGRRSGKEIRLRIEGEELELDRAILEALADPLVHLVRNAVDHGVEQSGTVSVRACREKDQGVIEVADDGRGLDSETIRRKAVEKGLLPPERARTLPERELFQLICLPGFSTAGRVTETSGRGVGMDVVKSAVEGLGGRLEIASAHGKGTRFRLRFPLSAAIIHLLLLECSGRRVAVPFTRVQRLLDLPAEQIRVREGRRSFRLADEEIPLLSLARLLRLSARPLAAGTVPVVLTEVRGRKIGLIVDRALGQRQAFVKGLAYPLDRLQGVSGATVLGDGSVVFVIDPQGLLEGRPTPTGRGAGEGESSCPSS